MGFGSALMRKDIGVEEKEFLRKAKKKSLWGSIGRTAGGLLAMGLTGGAVNPVTLSLITGAATFAGGAIGTKLSRTGDLSEGEWFKTTREDTQEELGAFGTANITESLKAGVTAGMKQKLNLAITDKTAAPLSKGAGMDFKDSFIGKSKLSQNIRSAKYFKDQGLSEFVDPNLQVGTESGKKIIAMDRTDPNLAINKRLGMGTGGETSYLDRVNKTALPEDIIPEITEKGGSLSRNEQLRYATTNRMEDAGYSVKPGGGLPDEFGTGYIGDKGILKSLFESERGRQAGMLQRRGDKVGFMNPQEAEKYAKSWQQRMELE